MSKYIFFEKIFWGLLFLFFSMDSVFATKSNVIDDFVQQGRTVTVVVSDKIDVLVGVNVIVKGTMNGGITDYNGRIQLQNVPDNAILEVSHIGFIKSEVPVGNQTTISIMLSEDTQVLDEVMVVGYGVQKKSQVTGAISQLKSDDMLNRSLTDVTQALQGKISGVQVFLSSGAPGTIGSVRIRGMGSNSNNDPLFVVDGRLVRDINYLDSDDIQSIEFLKDASAAAIYGARAGNGVILITTKQGEKGTTGTIEYSFMHAWQSNNNLPAVLNAKQYYDYQLAYSAANQTALDLDWGDKTTDTDWLGEIFETGYLSRHNLSFSGGQNDITYYLAGSILSNDGTVIGIKDKLDRYTGTVNGDYQVKKWLSITTRNNFSLSNTNGRSTYNVFGHAMRMSPLYTPTVSEPTTHMQTFVDQGYRLIQDQNGNFVTIPVFFTGDNTNPLATLNRNYAWEKRTRINGTTSLILTPFNGFTFTSRFAYSFDAERRYQHNLPGVFSSQSMTYNQSVDGRSETGENYQWENFGNYTQSIGKHHVTIMAGMSYIQSQSAYVRGVVAGTGRDIGFPNTDPLFAFPAYKSGSYNQVVEGAEEVTARQIAYFGRFNYEYANKYFLQTSIRADAADLSQLPVSGRWGYFPAVSLGWTISNEDFMNDYKPVSHLKLRVSWGQNGSTAGLGNYIWQNAIASGEININGVAQTTSYTFFPGQMIYTSGKLPSTAGNEGLKWETHEQFDLGFDLRILNNRFSFTYDWYQKITKDLIIPNITISHVMGIKASPFNAGKVVQSGHEFEFIWRDGIGKDFKYSINANFSTLKNEVKVITNALTYISGALQDSHEITRFEQGYPIWHFNTYHYTGVDAFGNPTFLDVNNNGVIDPDDKINCGSGLPNYYYGLTITANFKNFDFSTFGAGQGGNKIFQTLTRANQLQSNVPTYLLVDAWTENNKNTNIPKVGMDNIGYYFVSDALLFKGDYFKFKMLQIGYTLPNDLTKKISVEKLRIYASCENLFTITQYPGFDPEIMDFRDLDGRDTGMNLGIDNGRYPNNRNYILGVNLTF